VLTSIFATYAFVLVPSLVLFERLSDRFGGRPVIVAGLLVACGGLLLFAFAEGESWLYGARALQGLAVGMISGAATAALVELDPQDDRRRAAMFAGLARAGGSAAGPLLADVLAQWAPRPSAAAVPRRARADGRGRRRRARAAGAAGRRARALAGPVAARPA
jgi:MFS family permease